MTEEEHLRIAVTGHLEKISEALKSLLLVEEMHHATSRKISDRLNTIEAKIDALKGVCHCQQQHSS